MERTRIGKNGSICPVKERILKPSISKSGYLRLLLCKNGKIFNKTIHTIVWDTFGDKPRNGRELQVDHIDNNKQNNQINNLQLLPARENTSKGCMQNKNKSSKYTGVNWHKHANKWIARIQINKKNKHLGYFTSEQLAHEAYQKALSELNEQ